MAKKAIKKQEFETLMEYLKNDTKIQHNQKNKYLKIFTFLYYTGCRINEVCKLKTEDIQSILETKKARVVTSKTKRFKGQEFRIVNFSDKAVEEIKKYFSDCLTHPKAYCIRSWNNRDKQTNVTALTNYINSYIKKALNSKDYGTHSFRRGIITEMIIDNGVPPEVAQRFIGHKNYATTSLYVKATEQDVINNLAR